VPSAGEQTVNAAVAVVLAGTAFALPLAGQTTPPPPPVPRTARVSYVSGGQVYISAGRDHGLAEGQEVLLIRGDSVAALLRVLFLASRQAGCEVVRGARDVTPGEVVRFVPAPPPVALPPVAAAGQAPAARRRRRGGPGLHGRVAARYLHTTTDATGSFAQPAFDLRLTGTELGGTHIGLVADLRGRRSHSLLADGRSSTVGATDVYQFALSWGASGAPWRVALGRQYLPGVSSIILIDGLSAEVTPGGRAGRFSAGVFGGAETNPASFAVSPDVHTYGAYAQLRTAPAITFGLAGSYRSGAPNREFGFVQVGYTNRAVSLRAAQEIDYYRGAKVAVGEHSLSFTSSYLSLSVRPTTAVSLDAGFDNRRSVRLSQDVITPVTVFDDTYRQGAWGAVGYVRGHARGRLEARRTTGGSAGSALAVTGSVGLERLTPYALGLSLRTTRYRSSQLDGWFHAVRASGDPLPLLHLELTGGWRREQVSPASTGLRNVTWLGGEIDVGIGRSWYLLMSATRETGPPPEGWQNQGYASLSYRF
jgi:hypothetical protein